MDFWWFVIACFALYMFSPRKVIKSLQEDVHRHEREIINLRARLAESSLADPVQKLSGQPQTAAEGLPKDAVVAARIPERILPDMPLPSYKKAETVKEPEKEQRSGFEMQFGARLPVWIGGIALALSGFYFIKYSIDAGWLSPAVRIVIGLIVGAGSLFAAKKIIRNEKIADHVRIAQAIAGAGIAVLYFCVFAATNFYYLVPPLTGFAGMAVVTALAVVLSLLYGAPIALLGMIGGFLTPALMGSPSPSVPMLFGYLYAISLGLMIIIRRQRWWTLGMMVMMACFGWVAFWILSNAFLVKDTVWLGLFLFALAATSIKLLSPKEAEIADPAPQQFAWLTTGGSVVLMCLLGFKTSFNDMSLGLFWLLSAGSIVLARFDSGHYRLAPVLTLIASSVIIAAMPVATHEKLVFALVAFAALFAGSGYFLQSRTSETRLWSSLAVSATLLFYFIGYFKLHKTWEYLVDAHSWGLLALTLGAVSVLAVERLSKKIPTSHADRDFVLSLYAALSTAFISTFFAFVLDRVFLPLAMAGEVMALAWIGSRVFIPVLRKLAAVLGFIYGVLMSWQAVAAFGVIMLADVRLGSDNMPMLARPLIQLILPAIMFLMAALYLRRKTGGQLPHVLEFFSVMMLGAGAHFFSHQIMHPGQDVLRMTYSFTERGFMTDMIFVYAVLCLQAGRRFLRTSFVQAGWVLTVIALFRLGLSDFVVHNPLFDATQRVGDTALFNSLLLTYGVPVVLLGIIHRLLPAEKAADWGRALMAIMLVLVFMLVSLEVRQAFHGSNLASGIVSKAEIYAYSFAWLMTGLAMLVYGTLKKSKPVRVASLGVLLLVVCKVFLYDASALAGLLRVASFLGLGLSLLGLSWFYTRFIFKKD